LPSTYCIIPTARCTAQVFLATTNRQIPYLREKEHMRSVKTAWPTPQLAVMDEIVILVVYSLGKSVVSKNVQTRKSVLKLGLQRVVPIVSVVAEIVDTLSPSEAREKRLAEILRTWSGYRL